MPFPRKSAHWTPRDGLTVSLQALAWHRENVARLETPELDLQGGRHG